MNKFVRYLYYLGPVVFFMGVIFTLSSRQRLSVSEEYILNFLFFKTLHVLEYGFLYFLTYRASYNLSKKKKDAAVLSALITILYALTDEIHQTFVPTREGGFRDVFIDALGVAIMYMYIKRSSFIKRYI